MSVRVWKEIYDGRYAVSSEGEIKRIFCERRIDQHRVGKILKPTVSHKGYERVTICHSSGKKSNVSIHTVVAKEFLGERPFGKQINHKDANKRNNRPSNLEYVTPLENTTHSYANGLSPFGSKSKLSKLTENEVVEIRRLAASGVHKDILASAFGMSYGGIEKIVRREN